MIEAREAYKREHPEYIEPPAVIPKKRIVISPEEERETRYKAM